MVTCELNRQGEIAVVVFADRTDLWWLKMLHPGFRHCFVVLFATGRAVAIESLATGVAVSDLGAATPYEIAAAYRRMGNRAVITLCQGRLTAPRSPSVFSCVEHVKRTIGVHSRFTLTPYRLWKYFSR